MMWKPIVAAALVAFPAVIGSDEVREVRIQQAGDDTEIVILTGEDVEPREFLLSDPTRLIVDLYGARVSDLRGSYDGIGRGGRPIREPWRKFCSVEFGYGRGRSARHAGP